MRRINFLHKTEYMLRSPKSIFVAQSSLTQLRKIFLYDIIYKNRSKFRKPFDDNKKHFGYRFQDGEPLTATDSYTGFKQALVAYEAKYKFSLTFDVASYFNSIYHHDIISWFANLGATNDDVNSFGGYLRQSNSGRSIDCWPQGIYPAKMVGNDFLRFIEQHHNLKSSAIVRFMDDFVLYSDSQEKLFEDFYFIQKLLGQKGLSINPSKTSLTALRGVKVEEEIDQVKVELLIKRRAAFNFLYLGDFDEAFNAISMTPEELEYIRSLLKEDNLEEQDAELILSLYRENTHEVHPYLENFAISFPHLAKNIWSFCRYIDDPNFIGEFILNSTKNEGLEEYQLFWFAWILEDFLLDTPHAPELISKLYYHKNATTISKAKILEIPDNRYGLVELRDEHLVAGRSGWLSWASAVGHRNLLPISRNHKLEYFANSSPMNHLIKKIVSSV